MKVDLFDFELPDEHIALHPVSPRDHARLLEVRPGSPHPISDRKVCDLPDLLQPGDVLVVNNTSVLPAALSGVRARGEHRAKVSINLHKRLDDARWAAFAKPAKRLKPGDRISFGHDNNTCLTGVCDATVDACNPGGEVELQFDLSGPALDAAIATVGIMPLPPYIASKRAVEASDSSNYQTMFASRDGAVAAPTAGLHFTDELLKKLDEKGIGQVELTLHVGAGTFLPMKVDDTLDHEMHGEWGEISQHAADALNAVRANGGRIVAVGTTSLRLLESAASDDGLIQPFCGETDIFITPGYKFKGVDLMMTNFHLPRSTLFMLVSAFSGLDQMQAAYAHAINAGYRFYSYGDACLLHPTQVGEME